MSLPPLPPLPQLPPLPAIDDPQRLAAILALPELPPLPPITPAQALPLPPLPPLAEVTCKGPGCKAVKGGDIPHSAQCVADHEAQALPANPQLEAYSAAASQPKAAMCDGCTPENCSGCKVDKAGDVDPGSRAYKLPWGVTVEPVKGHDGAVSIGMKYSRPPDAYEPEADTPGVTPWFGMHELPNPERRGEYEVKISKRPRSNWPFPHSVVERHYWNGKNWPSLMGQFDAEAWRGLIERAV